MVDKLIPEPDFNRVFASSTSPTYAPTFTGYESGWEVTAPRNGVPELKEFNYIGREQDLKSLWIRQNGGGLPYNPKIKYADKAVVVKDGMLSQMVDGGWVEVGGGIKVVESIADMLAIKNPDDGDVVFCTSYHAGLNKGGGAFNFRSGSALDDGGVYFKIDSGSWQRVSMGTWRNVQWYGAVGDGVTDDLWAINLAIKSLKTHPDSYRSDASFCTIYFPPSDGAYKVTDTIYLFPWIRLKGDSPRGGSTAHNATKLSSRIGGAFPNDINYKWIISTSNVEKSTGKLLPWDGTLTGEQIDEGLVTPCFGVSVEDLWIDNITPAKRIYGAIKFIGAPQASITRCWTENTDVGVVVTGSWDVRIDVGTVSHKCGVAIWGSSNGVTLNGYQHAKPAVKPLPTQMGLFQTPVDVTCGVYCQWTPSVSSSVLICEYFRYGVYCATGVIMNIQSYYAEANGTAVYAVTSGVHIGNITGVANTHTLYLGDGAEVDILSVAADNYKVAFLEGVGAYAVGATIPNSVKVVDLTNGKILPQGHEGKAVVYLDATKGDDSWSGILSQHPVKTISKALAIVAARQPSNQWSDHDPQVRKECTIVVLDDSTYSPTPYHQIDNLNVVIQAAGGKAPKLQTTTQAFKLFDSDITLKGVTVQRGAEGSGQLSEGMFICNGVCSVNLSGGYIDLANPLVSVDAQEFADVRLSITGRTGTFSGAASYFKTSSKNVSVDAFVRYTPEGVNVNNTPDKGVIAPEQSSARKSVSDVY